MSPVTYRSLRQPFDIPGLVELVLNGLNWITCVIYLDDVIVFSKSFEEHLNQLAEVLERFQNAGLKLTPRKCNFFQREVRFLGYLISKEGVQPHPDNISKIKDWPIPTNVTDVRSILGMGNYYRHFIKGYSEIVQPLMELTKQDACFKWDSKCQKAFDQLKEKLMGAVIVAHPIG